MRSVNMSSEEGEVSEYPSSQRSTLESNPEAGGGATALLKMKAFARSGSGEQSLLKRLTVPEPLKRMRAVGSRDEPRIPKLQVTAASSHESPLKRMAAVMSQDLTSPAAGKVIEPLKWRPAVSQQDLPRMAALSSNEMLYVPEKGYTNDQMSISIEDFSDVQQSDADSGQVINVPPGHAESKTITYEM